MTSFPNQRKVTTHKPPFEGHFLQVSKADWMAAYQNLNRGDFGLYLYLCGNQNNYEFYLSSADVQKQLGVSDSTYRRAVKSLQAKGYITIGKNEHDFHFYTTPQTTDHVTDEQKEAAEPVISDTAASEPPADADPAYLPPYSPSDYDWED